VEPNSCALHLPVHACHRWHTSALILPFTAVSHRSFRKGEQTSRYLTRGMPPNLRRVIH